MNDDQTENETGEETETEDGSTPKAKRWFETLWRSDAAEKGGVIRRSKESVLAHVEISELQDVIYDKGFHLIEAADQYIIICSCDEIKIFC